MEISKHKYFIKLKRLLFFCCALVLSLTIVVNIILALYKNKILQTLSNHFFAPVSVENIFYLPPNFIVLKSISVAESKIRQKILNLPISCVRFSLSSLFLEGNFQITSIYSLGLNLDLNRFLSFTKENFTQILDFLTHLPNRDFKLTVRGIAINSFGKNIYPDNTKADLNLKISGTTISASGSVGKNLFSLQGSSAEKQINIDNFKFLSKDINSQLRGRLNPNLVEFKGYFLINNMNPAEWPGLKDILILDIDSRITIASEHIKAERLNFSINNNPVRLTADIFLSDPFTCNLKFFSDFRSLDNKQEERLKNVALIAEITAGNDKTIALNGSLDIASPEQKKESLPLEKLKLDVKNALFNFKESFGLKLSASQINLFSQTSANTYNINLENFLAESFRSDKNLQSINFSAQLYDGTLQGNGQIKMQQFMPAVSADIQIKNVSTDKLDGLLIHFSKVRGKLSSQMSFTNYPQLVLKGLAHIRDGSLNNFEFLKWLADLFELPPLKKIEFSTASADFIADKEGVEMYNMDLDATDVKIEGYFRLKENDLVSSKMFLSLRSNLLQKSPRFTPLLRLINAKQELIKFNFQLSGNLHGMNFQWLKSGFKDDLQKAIPNFAKRGFEEKIEKVIGSILEE